MPATRKRSPDDDRRFITVRGAREHNLRSVDVAIPKNELVVMTGVSGSGKSSLAFDTIYAEGQRRYVESLSSYARQFLGQLPKPDVDAVTGLAPAISIQQKVAGNNPRSTVGTVTEIYDYLRVLFARVGQGYCYVSGKPIRAQTREQIVEAIERTPEGRRFQILAPVVKNQKGEFRDLFDDLLKKGFVRARVDGDVYELTDPPKLKKNFKHDIEVVVDRLVAGKAGSSRLAEAVETALDLGDGALIVAGHDDDSEKLYSANYACAESGMSYEPPSPQLFSFNSPVGMCPDCQGLGIKSDFVVDRLIPDDSLSVNRGAIGVVGKMAEVGRWRKQIYKGAAAAIEADCGMDANSLLKTAWKKLPEDARHKFLYGTGERHVTFSWRGYKRGGTWEGVIGELTESYRTTNNPMRRRQLEKYMDTTTCSSCGGARLNRQARNVRVTTASERFAEFDDRTELSLPDVCALTIEEAHAFFDVLDLDETGLFIAEAAIKEIRDRLGFLLKCGLDYLTLDRRAPTLSGGESQRIRLAGQIGSGLVGVVYILDEPSIGLHPRDNAKLLASLEDLRDQGNTVLVVEHDEETMRAADRVIDFGPGPGVRGGEIVAEGSVDDVMRAERSLTGAYLSGRKEVAIPADRRGDNPDAAITVRGATHHNLKGVDARIPLGRFVCVTGVSGSGKSSLVNDILWQVLNRDVNGGNGDPGAHESVEGLDFIDKAIDIDQSPIGRTPRSNPATYTKLFDEIRKLYTHVPEAKLRGFGPGRFSFNTEGGRCEHCEGHGATKLEMDFLADIWVKCPVCDGKRFGRETLEIQFKGKSIADVLEMDVQEALTHFENVPKVRRMLATLHDVGLDYMKVGQPSPTLSGGEAQRIKLARELGKRSTGKTFYVLDEPTTGLHFADVDKLLEVLHGLVDRGNTVLVVEHALDVIKTADWVIDIGPEGGAGGGTVVAEGPPEAIAACADSHTGRALRDVLPKARLKLGKRALAAIKKADAAFESSKPTVSKNGHANGYARDISIVGAKQHNLRGVDATVPRDRISVFCGPSGSGKSSLAMDTLYAEGQRRYVESLSAYARQFLGQMPKPRVESVRGLSPAVAIEQKTVGGTPRSTVGTVTEIYDYLRILFARLGTPYCPECQIPVRQSTTDEVVDRVLEGEEGSRALICAPLDVPKTEAYSKRIERLATEGFQRVRIDGDTFKIGDAPEIEHRGDHEVALVVDRITVRAKDRGRIADSVEAALEYGRGVIDVVTADRDKPEADWPTRRLSVHLACEGCGRSFEPLAPQNFSFNSPLGWCEACEGLGVETGTDPSVLIANPNLTLAEGAVSAWPDPEADATFGRMLDAMSATFGLPLDVPFFRLSGKLQRVVLYGADASVEVPATEDEPAFRFRYRGLYPSVEEAQRLSYFYRQKLREMVGEGPCTACRGDRVRDDAAAVKFSGMTLPELARLPMGDAFEFLDGLKLTRAEKKIAGDLLTESVSRLRFLVDVGLDYVALDRPMPTLSGGESQRIRLAGQIGRALTGVLYVLDEPTIGLHPRDNGRLVRALFKLRDLGNTVVLVEHDREVLEAADRLYDFGPGAGRLGGTVVAEGTPKELAKSAESLTGKYLADVQGVPVPRLRRVPADVAVPDDAELRSDDGRPTHEAGWLELLGCRHHNLREVDLRIPLATLTCVTGVSGSGKSSLIEGTLAPAVARRLSRSAGGPKPGPHRDLFGVQHLSKLIAVDQQPLGATPASNPATYTGVFDHIRDLFARLPEAKVRGYKSGRFSFNRPGGRCEACEGLGEKKIEMHFLPDVWVTCEECQGRRYNAETLAVKFRGKTISDVLEMPIGEAYELFEQVPKIRAGLGVLTAIGLDYLTLGQGAQTLSGGEAQRVKLAAELARPEAGRTLYLLDEPTTGLHLDDIRKLLQVLNGLVDKGNTVVVVEHNLDVIKTADWVVDVGPEAGVGGGSVVVSGPPEVIAECDSSHTGRMLAPLLKEGKKADRETFDVDLERKKRSGDLSMREVGKDAKMPWQVDGKAWHSGDRPAHNGKPVKYDAGLVPFVVDLIEKVGGFAPAKWNDKAIVEVLHESKQGGWFFHAKTGLEWFVHLTFRVKKRTFDPADLAARFPWPPADDLDIPTYGAEPRVWCKHPPVPWQEVTFKPHSVDELDTDEFRAFLEEAKAAYLAQAFPDGPAEAGEGNGKAFSADEPWKTLGRTWHLSKRGLPDGRIAWSHKTLTTLAEMLEEVFADSAVDWTKKATATWKRGGKPVAELTTKRRTGIDLVLPIEPGAVTLGQVIDFGVKPSVGRHRGGEAVKLRFTAGTQVTPALKAFLSGLG